MIEGATPRRRAFVGVKRLAGIGVVLLILEYLVVPQVAGARKALHVLEGVNVALVALAVGLEAAALAAYGRLTRTVLPRRSRPPFGVIMRIDLATLALSHVLPGGSAAGSALGYRLLAGEGVQATDAALSLATQGIGSAIVLNAILWLGLVVSIPLRGFSPLYGVAAVVGSVLLASAAVVVMSLTRGEQRASAWLRFLARKSHVFDEHRVHAAVHRASVRVRELGSDRRLMLRAVGWATANWLLDAGCLWVFLLAFGHRLGPDALLVSYGLANVVAAIPITPGGLGVTEAVLATSLVGFGTPRGIAVLAVLGYRLVNFWLPIPVGAAAYLSLRPHQAAHRRRVEELQEVAARAAEESEHVREWAARKGLRVPE